MTATTPSNLAYLSNFSLAGQVALVTGAGRGLGLEIARALAGSGAHVLLNGRDAATLEARVAGIEADGGSASALAFDVSDRAAVRDAFARIGREHGRLDVLVQNVGQRNRKPLADLTDDEIVALLDVDLASSLILAREAARLMLPRGRGRLIAVTSVAGQIARANDSVYAAAKSGLNGMVRALAAEYGPQGLTSNAIAPGFFATETNMAIVNDPERGAYFTNRTPMRRWGRPEEIAGAAVFLASAAASYVNGHVLVVDGGATILM